MSDKRIFKISYYLSLSFILCFFLYPLLFDEMTMNVRLLFNVSIIITLAIATHFYVKEVADDKKQKIYQIVTFFLFIFYLAQLINLLFFAAEFARDNTNYIGSYRASLAKQWQYNTNLTPFYTIKSLLPVVDLAHLSHPYVYVNIVGNFIAFMPFGLFLPLLFKKQRKLFIFIVTMIGLVSAIEILQFLTLTGSMDIDDLILNVGGAICFYSIIRICMWKKFKNGI